MKANPRLPLALFFMRISIFIVMLMWTIDKFLNVQHAKMVFARFYHITGLEDLYMYGIAGLEGVLIILFVLGIKKRLTYGLVFLFHFVSTASSYEQYLNPYAGYNLLFFAAIPMLAACFTLYIMRDSDRMLSL